MFMALKFLNTSFTSRNYHFVTAVTHGTIFLIPRLDCPLLVYSRTTDFCALISLFSSVLGLGCGTRGLSLGTWTL